MVSPGETVVDRFKQALTSTSALTGTSVSSGMKVIARALAPICPSIRLSPSPGS